jgi:hypothetical protein
MPPEAALVEINPKPHQYYLWHLQHGYQDEVWPKLVHYRVSVVPDTLDFGANGILMTSPCSIIIRQKWTLAQIHRPWRACLSIRSICRNYARK